MSALWASNCFAPIVANVDKFKQQLSIDEIEIIETLAQEYMALYGYELMTPARAALAGDLLPAARLRSEERKRQSWRELESHNFRDYILRRYRADYLAQVRSRLELAAAAPQAA